MDVVNQLLMWVVLLLLLLVLSPLMFLHPVLYAKMKILFEISTSLAAVEVPVEAFMTDVYNGARFTLMYWLRLVSATKAAVWSCNGKASLKMLWW